MNTNMTKEERQAVMLIKRRIAHLDAEVETQRHTITGAEKIRNAMAELACVGIDIEQGLHREVEID